MKNLFALLLCLCTALSLFAQAPNANYDPDWDGDGNLGVSDLLGFLGLFGDYDVDDDGIWDSVDDCTDMNACNYDWNPSVHCAYLDALGICGGWCESDENEDGICDFTCGVDSIAYNGYTYATIEIGEQCWFAENLRTELYLNGDSIPGLLTMTEWSLASFGAQSVYGEPSGDCIDSPCDEDQNLINFGRLYNWYATVDSRGLCPTGWHVPEHIEHEQLVEYLGTAPIAGAKLKSSPGDIPPWDGNNDSGFSALNTGRRGTGGDFVWTNTTYFWTTTSIGPHAMRMLLSTGYSNAHLSNDDNNNGFAVRCIKD